jgi:hypothetical protein
MDLLIIIGSIILLIGLFLIFFTNKFLDYISSRSPRLPIGSFNATSIAILSLKGKDRGIMVKIIGIIISIAGLLLLLSVFIY